MESLILYGWRKYYNPNRENYLVVTIHTNPIRHSGINFVDSLTNPYLLQIHKRIRTGFLSLIEIKGGKKGRLEEIWKLHKEGKSTREMTDWMNEKYLTTLRSRKPYYPSLIYETIKKYRKRLERLNDHFHSYEYVDLVRIEEVLKWKRLPENLRIY